jgi:hypothetical protein
LIYIYNLFITLFYYIFFLINFFSHFSVTCLSLFEKPAKNPTLQLDAEEQKAVNEPLSWGRLRYVQILTTRANLMAALSEVNSPVSLSYHLHFFPIAG